MTNTNLGNVSLKYAINYVNINTLNYIILTTEGTRWLGSWWMIYVFVIERSVDLWQSSPVQGIALRHEWKYTFKHINYNNLLHYRSIMHYACLKSMWGLWLVCCFDSWEVHPNLHVFLGMWCWLIQLVCIKLKLTNARFNSDVERRPRLFLCVMPRWDAIILS